ncbi:unnamed protein product [Calypogeia fissa]
MVLCRVFSRWATVIMLAMMLSSQLLYGVEAQLSTNFYATTCPALPMIARNSYAAAVLRNLLAPASLVRLSFHDCAVDGCEGSVLLNSGKGGTDEKLSSLNLGISNLQVIDTMKMAVERRCPGVVSCSDLVVLAAAFSVVASGGPNMPVLLGRRDGLTSSTAHANQQLLPPTASVDTVLGTFAQAGLDTMHTVALLGSHTMGVGHCPNIVNRLYPTLDTTLLTHPFYAQILRRQCPATGSNPNTIVPNDLTNIIFDSQYFRDVMSGRGLFSIDAALATDPRTAPFVQQFAMNQNLFFQTFSDAYVKLTQFRVLTGSQGQIRTNCRSPN